MKAHPGARRPKDLWSAFRSNLRSGFHDRCGYAAMFVAPDGTVDHYFSYRNRPDLAYTWSNYRFASGLMNNRKKNHDDHILDPYEVKDGWFEIILPSLQLCLTDAVPPEMRERAAFTLKRLRLQDGEDVIRWRRAWYEQYQNGHMDLLALERFAPLISAAVRRQNLTSE